MKKTLVLVFGLLTAVSFMNMASVAQAEQKATGRTLNVKLSYTGSGTVDDKHLIQVFLWDSADFVKGGGGMPITMKASASKNGTVTFSELDKSPIFVSVAYDPKGDYNEVAGPPPSGSSLGMYAKAPGTPEPVKIEPGATAEIEIAFDDSYKMP
jgi:hypothetical protein